MASAFSGARENRLDLSVGIALGSATPIALFVAAVLVLANYAIGPAPMTLQFWPGAMAMMLFATLTATFVANSGRSAWFVGGPLHRGGGCRGQFSEGTVMKITTVDAAGGEVPGSAHYVGSQPHRRTARETPGPDR
jgi:hypothetical protein